jgi:general secretion pathway protein F
MPNFRYRALTQTGEVVSGSISAPTAAEVARRIDYLRLVPIDSIVEEGSRSAERFKLQLTQRVRAEDVTIFTRDLALLLKAGARLNDALELLATDMDIGRLRSTVSKIRAGVLAGETLADALARHPHLFAALYVALVRVGESSGTLECVLEVLANERIRAEALRRKLADALRYPAFVLFAATCVLMFFLMFVLPQFAAVLRDFGAKIDPLAGVFLGLSEFMTAHKEPIGVATIGFLSAGFLATRHATLRTAIIARLLRLPLIRAVSQFHQTALFCRNLGVLLGGAVPLTPALRILADMMASLGEAAVWSRTVEQVRQGRKLSDALADGGKLPALAVRMLRLGEETGQLPVLAGRVAEYYETKLQRSLDRIVGIIGPAAIVSISVIVGGLIVSVMTSLISVSQLVG